MSTPFGFKERLGIVLIVEAASLSVISVTILLAYFAWQAVKAKKNKPTNGGAIRPVHIYFINLMVSDLVMAIGGVLSAKWAKDAGVVEGAHCIAQGALKQIGNVGVALTSLILAIHTFCVLVFRIRSPRWWNHSASATSVIMVIFIWIFIACMVAIGAAPTGANKYYVNTGYWCWIHKDFLNQRIAFEYLWIWFSCFASIIIYGFIFLFFRGTIIVTEDNKIQLGGGTTPTNSFASVDGKDKEQRTLALQMLFYPAVYIMSVFPISVLRWREFSIGIKPPFEATVFSSILFSLSGVFNVTLFLVTRPSVVRPYAESRVVASSLASNADHPLGSDHLPEFMQMDLEAGVGSPLPDLEKRRIDPGIIGVTASISESEKVLEEDLVDEADSDDYRGSRGQGVATSRSYRQVHRTRRN